MRRLLLAIVTFILLLIAPIAIAQASDGAGIIDGLNVTVQLHNDGTATVNEQLNFANPTILNWPIYTKATSLKVSADGQALPSNKWETDSGSEGQLIVQTNQPSQLYQLSYSAPQVLIREQNADQLYLKLLENTGYYIYNPTVTLNLPSSIKASQLSGNLYAIDGIINATTVVGNHQVIYQSDLAANQSIFTISASWPKSALNLTLWQEWRLDLLNLAGWPWLILGLLLPLITVAVLLILLRLIKRNEQVVTETRNQPPSSLSPVLVGLLVRKKLYPEVISALLVDLCQRGYLLIIKKADHFVLSQRKPADNLLQDWERAILDQLFPKLGQPVEQVQDIGAQQLFSPGIAQAFGELYQVSTDLQFFAENPHFTRVRYKLLALVFYFGALIGLVYLLVSNSSPYLLIPLLGTLLLAYVIIRLSPQLIRYTDKGFERRVGWLAFSNYLSANAPLSLEASQGYYFEKYLAYAIALNQTNAWADRFERSSVEALKPEWFFSYEPLSIDDLAKEIEGFTQTIAKQITQLRGPLVN